jgi:hypothetical protein
MAPPLNNNVGDRWFVLDEARTQLVRALSVTDIPPSTVGTPADQLKRRVRLPTGETFEIDADHMAILAKEPPARRGRQALVVRFHPNGRPVSATPAASRGTGIGYAAGERRRLSFDTPAGGTSTELEDAPTPFARAIAPRQPGEAAPVIPTINEVPEAMVCDDAVFQLAIGTLDNLAREDLALLLWHAAQYQPDREEALTFHTWWTKKAAELLGGRIEEMPEGIVRILYVHAHMEAAKTFLAAIEPAAARPRSCGPAPVDRMEDEEQEDGELPEDEEEQPPPAKQAYNMVPPPDYGSTEPKRVRIPMDVADPGMYPPCFAMYDPPNPADVHRLHSSWNMAVATALKQAAKPKDNAAIKEPMRYLKGIFQQAGDILATSGVPAPIVDGLGPLGQLKAELALKLMGPVLGSRVRERVRGEVTINSLSAAWDQELIPPADRSKLVKTAFRTADEVKFTPPSDLFGKFVHKFEEHWEHIAAKVNFSDEYVAEWRKIDAFTRALPMPIYERFLDHDNLTKFNDMYPDTWKATVELARECHKEVRQEAKAAETASNAKQAGNGLKRPRAADESDGHTKKGNKSFGHSKGQGSGNQSGYGGGKNRGGGYKGRGGGRGGGRHGGGRGGGQHQGRGGGRGGGRGDHGDKKAFKKPNKDNE